MYLGVLSTDAMTTNWFSGTYAWIEFEDVRNLLEYKVEVTQIGIKQKTSWLKCIFGWNRPIFVHDQLKIKLNHLR